jgi:Predicted xylanase/chitin deacetylase
MILLYHLIFPDETPLRSWNAGNLIRLSAFRRQLQWLKRRFSFLSLEDYLALYRQGSALCRGKAALTFDDGYARTYALAAPVLREEGIPATFFTNTSNLNHGLLWFVYFNALCSERAYPALEISGGNYPLDTKRNFLARLEDPHPARSLQPRRAGFRRGICRQISSPCSGPGKICGSDDRTACRNWGEQAFFSWRTHSQPPLSGPVEPG